METENYSNLTGILSLNSSDDGLQLPISDTTYRIIFFYLLAVVIMGAGGNLVVIYTFIRCKSLHNATNMLIVNLSVSDVIVALSATPLSVTSTHYHHWIFGHVGCNIYGFINYYCGCISLNTLAMISFFRYNIVVRRKNKPFRILPQYAILAIHAYTLIFSSPPLFGWNRFVLEGFKIGCDLDFRTKTPANISYVCYMFVFLFFVPLIVIVWSYWKIYRVIQQHRKSSIAKNYSSSRFSSKTDSMTDKQTRSAKSSKSSKGYESEAFRKREKSRRKSFLRQKMTLITILVTIAVFLFVWLPYCVVSLWTMLGDESKVPKIATVIPNLFAKSCVIYNPVVYVLLNPTFRRALIYSMTPGNCFLPSSRQTNFRM